MWICHINHLFSHQHHVLRSKSVPRIEKSSKNINFEVDLGGTQKTSWNSEGKIPFWKNEGNVIFLMLSIYLPLPSPMSPHLPTASLTSPDLPKPPETSRNQRKVGKKEGKKDQFRIPIVGSLFPFKGRTGSHEI